MDIINLINTKFGKIINDLFNTILRFINICIAGIIIIISYTIIIFIVNNIYTNDIYNIQNNIYNNNIYNNDNINYIHTYLNKNDIANSNMNIINIDYNKYVNLTIWSNKFNYNNLPQSLLPIIYKPLQWRPTLQNNNLFTKEMDDLYTSTVNKINTNYI